MYENVSVLVALVVAGAAVASLFLILMFLLIVYLKGGIKHLKIAGEVVAKIRRRDLGVLRDRPSRE